MSGFQIQPSSSDAPAMRKKPKGSLLWELRQVSYPLWALVIPSVEIIVPSCARISVIVPLFPLASDHYFVSLGSGRSGLVLWPITCSCRTWVGHIPSLSPRFLAGSVEMPGSNARHTEPGAWCVSWASSERELLSSSEMGETEAQSKDMTARRQPSWDWNPAASGCKARASSTFLARRGRVFQSRPASRGTGLGLGARRQVWLSGLTYCGPQDQ